MVAAIYNFNIEKGSNFEINFLYTDENNNPINLTDKCVQFSLLSSDESKVCRYSSLAPAIYQAHGWSLTANNLGQINIKLSASITNDFDFDSASYDLDIKDQTTLLNNVRLAQGIITIIDRNTPIDTQCNTSVEPCEIQISPTPIPSQGPITPTPTVTEINDFCLPYSCALDLFSVVHDGSGLALNDLSTVSGSVTVTNTGIISNVELAINQLRHSSPTDLVMLLAPPSGDKILLAANHKIPNFNNNFSFTFSNKADSNKYLHNISNGQTCRIYDKTSLINYNSETLNSSFDHLFNHAVTGVWNLIVKDTDPSGSGNINSWKLIITYNSDL